MYGGLGWWLGAFALLRSAPGRIRTCDLRIRSPLLCPLSYRRWRQRIAQLCVGVHEAGSPRVNRLAPRRDCALALSAPTFAANPDRSGAARDAPSERKRPRTGTGPSLESRQVSSDEWARALPAAMRHDAARDLAIVVGRSRQVEVGRGLPCPRSRGSRSRLRTIGRPKGRSAVARPASSCSPDCRSEDVDTSAG
jgi:hypothetical protein